MEKMRSHTHLLRSYRNKRDFSKTSEPEGADPGNGTGHAFVVQKHAASHLHYDFRLEMDGVLKSWAVAKGPSVDPAVKRLAVEVEDHPLAYGRFEGVIPKGQYGGGTVMLWDRGTWYAVGDPHKDYEAGRLKFRLNGNKMKGQWALVRMKPRPKDRHNNWLLIKDRDPEAEPGNPDKLLKDDKSVKTGREMEAIAAGNAAVTSKSKKTAAKKTKKPAAKKALRKLPAFIEPQLATRVDKPPEGETWLHEMKFDVYRLHCRLENGDVRILTRHGEDWTRKFTELADAIKSLPAENAYIDGEAVILNEAGISDFSALQAWFKTPGRRKITFYAFDILFLDGEDVRALPLLSRKEILRDLVQRQGGSGILYSDHQIGSGKAFFAAAAGLGLEGILSKDSRKPYVSGRSSSWLKIKRIERQEFVIGGYTMSRTGSQSIGALLLGEYQGKRLVYVGKVGTGFSAANAKSLFKSLSGMSESKSPFGNVPADVRRGALWVKPELIAEIEFGAWTSDHILRHSSFLGLREDKEIADVQTEKVLPVKDAVKTPVKRAKSGADVLGITITHPERIIYPAEGVTKLDVAQYYEAVAKVMLPHVAERPLSLVRCPDGVGPACFFQKHAGAGLPDAVHEHRIGSEKSDAVLTINSPEGLVSLVQRGVLEVHTWGSHLDHVEKPDLVIFDLDPDPTVKWPKVRGAAIALRDHLDELGLKSFVKTTGGKGLHVVVPITPALEWDGVKQFSKLAAQDFSATDPTAYLVNMSKKARSGRIFIDYLRNGRGATAVAPYSTRARPGATIATPLSWKELEDGAVPGDFTITTVIARVSKGFKDPWKGLPATKQKLTIKMIKALAGST